MTVPARMRFLPDPYVSELWNEFGRIDFTRALGAAVWPTANKAYYVPAIFPVPATIYSLSFGAANGTGNYDLGLYDGDTLKRIASSGSTAMTAAGTKTLTISPDYRVQAGKVYLCALSLSSASGSVARWAMSLIGDGSLLGMGQQLSALPLPDPAVPVLLTGAGYVPLFVFGVR